MQQQASKSRAGNLVLVSPGSYLTTIEPGYQNAATVLFQAPTIGIVLDSMSPTNHTRIVQIHENSRVTILAHEKYLKNIEE